MNPLSLLGWQRYLVYGALALAVMGMAWIHGYSRGERKLYTYQAEQAREAVRIIKARGEVTERVVTRYIKVAGETQVVTNTVEKEVVRYATLNPGSCLDPGWGRLHDAAARNQLPEPEPPADGPLRAPAAAPAGAGPRPADGRAGDGHGDGQLRPPPPLR